MTTNQRNRNAKRAVPLAAAMGVLGTLILWACHLGPEESKDSFDIVGDTTWTRCHSVQVILLDEAGKALDTLFDDSLASVDQLKRLDASKYEGGKGSVAIKGFLADGGSCFEQKRTFEEGGSKVEVKPILDPNVSPTAVTVDPENLVLAMGSPAANLKAEVLPAHANPAVAWSVDGSGVVVLEGLEAGKGNPARVKPLKAGNAKVTVRSLKDTSKSFTVDVRVTDLGTGNIKIGKDTVFLYVNGKAESLTVSIPLEYAGQKVEWRTADADIAIVDADGRIQPVKQGETQVRATLLASGLTDVAIVLVRKDIPRLMVNAPKGAAVGGEIVFEAVATQEYGTLVSFRWDLLGDGVWDGTNTKGWQGDTVYLPAVSQKYDKQGTYTAKFQVLDSEGNLAEAEVTVDIGNQAPEIAFLRKDTVISVKDSIPMEATAKDVDGKVVWAGWDYEGDGQFDDTLTGDKAELKASLGHRYHEAGTYNAVFRAVDDNGKAIQDTAKIKVEFDEPVADAGPDITVTSGADFTFSAKGTDGFGSIVKRELKVGTGEFKTLSNQDTVLTAPAQPAVVRFIVRVTDDDGLSDVDTALVTVILSSNADLSGLTLSAGTLVPAFNPNAQNYAAQVAFSDSMVTVTPTVRVSSTKIAVNGKEIPSGTASDPVKLALGTNPGAFQIIVTAADQSQRVYSVSIIRHPNSEATLSSLEAPGLSLSPDFSSTVLDYADTVLHSVTSVTFKAVLASKEAGLVFSAGGGDSAMTSGTITLPQILSYGENLFKFVVTAQDGKSRTTYQVRILRLGRLLVQRKMGGAAPAVVDSFDMPVESSRPLSGGSYAGWKFLKWSIIGGAVAIADSAGNPTTITLKSGLARVQAAFEMLRYTVDLDVKGCGKVDPGVDSTYDHGTSPKYLITAAGGCRIQSVKVDGKEEPGAYSGTYTFTNLSANHTLAIQFVRTYVIQWTAIGKGAVTPPSATVDSGSSVTFTTKPDAGYKVAKDGVCIEKACTNPRPDGTVVLDTVRAGRSITAVFVRAYRMTASVARGVGDVTPKDTLVDSASIMAWQFNYGINYRVDSLLVNGVLAKEPAGGILTVNGVNRDTDVRLILRRQYAMTVLAGPGGAVNQVTGKVDSMASLAFTATPNAGYRVDSVLVNGALVTTNPGTGQVRNWTVANIVAITAVRVTFKRYYSLDVKPSSGATVNPQSVDVDSAASQAFTFTLPAGYYFTSLTLGEVNLMPYLSGTTLTIPKVEAGGTIVPLFSNLYTITLTSNLAKEDGTPALCIYNSANRYCMRQGETSLSVELPYKSTYDIVAQPTVVGDPKLEANNFHYWHWPAKGGEQYYCEYTMKVEVTANAKYATFYSTAKPACPL